MWKFREWITCCITSLAEQVAQEQGNRMHNALAYTLAEMEPKKFVDTVAHIKGR